MFPRAAGRCFRAPYAHSMHTAPHSHRPRASSLIRARPSRRIVFRPGWRPARPSRGPGNHRHRVSPPPGLHEAILAILRDEPINRLIALGSSKAPRAWERCLCDGQLSCCSPTWSLRGRLFLGFFGVRGRRRILRHHCPRQQVSRPRPRPRSSGRRSCALPCVEKRIEQSSTPGSERRGLDEEPDFIEMKVPRFPIIATELSLIETCDRSVLRRGDLIRRFLA
jgi:hypothetical protein